jgi:hypothetical protein
VIFWLFGPLVIYRAEGAAWYSLKCAANPSAYRIGGGSGQYLDDERSGAFHPYPNGL